MLTKFVVFQNLYRMTVTPLRNAGGRARTERQKRKQLEEYNETPKPSMPFLIGTDPVPGIHASEFIERRSKLLEMLIMTDVKPNTNHMIVMPSTSTTRGDSVKHNVNTMYLTGISDKKACLVILYVAGGAMKTILFHDTLEVKHVGGIVKAEDLGSFGFDELYPYSQMNAFLHGLFKTVRTFKLWFEDNSGVNELETLITSISRHHGVIGLSSPARFIHRLRVVKSPAEIELIRRGSNIIATAFNNAMEVSKPGVSTYTLESMIYNTCQNLGGRRPSKNLAGEDPEKLSYLSNMNKLVQRGDLMLIEAGCEYNTYTSTIARIWPVSGEFTPLQKLMYNALYKVHLYLIQSLKQSASITLDQLYNKMCIQLGKELRSISFIKSATAMEISKLLPKYCPLNIANFTGLETVDASLVSKNTPLVPGMTFTLKPGISISHHATDVSENYRGFSMQIQDCILVTPRGIEVLTDNCKVSPSDISNIVGSGV